MSQADPPIAGHCDAAFAAVREAFAENFRAHDEIGASCCIRVGGREVVDLWGGHLDATRARVWQRDTLCNAYSVGKGVLAILVLHLVEAGLLDYDELVVKSWPEFGAEGKGALRLADLLAHRAGLPGARRRLGPHAMYDWSLVTGALAAQAAYWEPGKRHGYHVNTFGFLVGEVLRRRVGVSCGEALAARLAGPMGAEFHWGLPAELHARMARICTPDAEIELNGPEDWAKAMPPTGDAERDEMIWHTYFNPPGASGIGTVNTAEWRFAEIPSTNGSANARGVARLYDTVLGRSLTPLSRELVARAAAVSSDGVDAVLGRPSRFGMGFQLAQPERPLGPNADAFGHFGYGGALGFADPVAGVAFGYVMNRPGVRWQTPRSKALIDALYACL